MTEQPDPVVIHNDPGGTPSRRTGLRDRLAEALATHDCVKLEVDVPAKDHDFWDIWRASADAALAVLYREWPWLRAEAEDTATGGAPTAPPDTITDPAWLQAQYTQAIKSVRLRLTPDPIVMTMIQAGSGFHLKDEEAWPVAAAILRVRDRHLEQLRQRLTLADAELRDYSAAESADAAAGSYALRAETAEQQRDQLAAVLREVLTAFHPVHTADQREVKGYAARVDPATHQRWTGVLGQPKEQL